MNKKSITFTNHKPCRLNAIDMKKLLPILTAALMLCSCSVLSNVNWNAGALTSAAGKAAVAASITDEQIVELCRQSVAQLDAENVIETGKYHQRLMKLVSPITVPGLKLNYKVYKKDEINAFACGDGSVRVYTGLMDLMDDNELLAVIGHEIGHVVNRDSKRAMKKAYMNSAIRDAVASAGSLGAVTSSLLGDLGEAYLNSQFSQKQELAADEYGFNFTVSNGYSPYSMGNALSKLVTKSSQQQSKIQQMFSSHPDAALRAQKMKEKADAYAAVYEN